MNLNNFFNPKSIAIVGASQDKKKIGAQILNNIIVNGFKGSIFPINLKEDKISGFKAFADLSLVGRKIDLAVIVIPANFVLAEIEKCVKLNIKNIIIISAGFGENSEEGKIIEEKITTIAFKNKINILGPNCLGLINSSVNLNATFVRAKNKKGSVAFLSQSGAVCAAALDWAQGRDIGFSKFVSLGNKAVLDENDFFEYFLKDKETKTVVAYLEEIKDGERFMAAVSRLSKIKPVAILKSGKSEAGSAAAMSHTGSIAGSMVAVEAGLRRSGAIIIDNLEEMFDFVSFSQKQVEINNNKIFLISNAGGPLVMAADEASRLGLEFASLSDSTKKELEKKLPAIVKIKNPMDLIGDADSARYKTALDVLLKEKNVSCVLALLTPQSSTDVLKTAEVLVSSARKYNNKLVCASFIGGEAVLEGRELMSKEGVVNFDFPSRALNILSKLAEYGINKKTLKPYIRNKNNKTIKSDKQLDFIDSFKLLKKYGIPVVKNLEVKKENDLIKIKYPIAMKVVGKNLIHKTDKGAIALNIKDAREARKYFNNFKSLLRDKNNYCLAQSMVSGGEEIIVGFKRDESFGPIVMVGLGGVYVEVMKDVKTFIADASKNVIKNKIEELKIFPILKGSRGKEGSDIDALVDIIVKVAKIAKENSDIHELDINPLFLNKKGALAVDIRIIV